MFVWDKSIALNAETGECLVIARKDRNSDDWYVAARTNEVARKVGLPVNFLQEGDKYLAQIYRDGDNAYFESKPYDIVIEEKVLTSDQTLTFDLGRSGGRRNSIYKAIGGV